MKIYSTSLTALYLTFGALGIASSGQAQESNNLPITSPLSPSASPLSSVAVLEQARSVSEAQLKILSDQKRNPTDWVGGTMWAGISEFSRISGRPLEADAVIAMGDKVNWTPISHTREAFHADDDCIGQAFLDAYAQTRNPAYLEPIRKDMDALVKHLNEPADAKNSLTWSWCDALFMAPPVLARLSNLTGDPKYLDAMDKEWWRVSAQLYNPQEKLYFRDSRFFTLTTKNGKKVFWSRGNGWVLAGLARVLTWMPSDYPTRPKYEQTFKDMAGKLLSLQGADGAWRTSLLDAEEFPAPEASGTAFFCYGMAWGVNQGLLPKATYTPAINKAWGWLTANKRPDGVIGGVQRVGDRPGLTKPEDTQLYATGSFLLAATELAKLTASGPTIQAVAPVGASNVSVQPPATPATFARQVPERADDFAWENDLVAFRAYGPAIKQKGSEGEDSGIDCWFKRVNYPILNKWYAGEPKGISYHQDHGEGYDAYSVGSSRGCGGLGIWKNGQMIRSGPYKTWKIIEQTPAKTVFELGYDYVVDGENIHEDKRISIELGQQLFQAQSTFTKNGKPVALDIVIGITTHDGKATPTFAPKAGWMSCWETIDGQGVGTGVVIAPAKVVAMREVKSPKKYESHALLFTKTDADGRVTYRAGYGWEKAGVIKTSAEWQAYLTQIQ